MTGRPDPWNGEITALDRAVSAALWAAGVAWMVPWVGIIMAGQSVLGPDRVDRTARRFARVQMALTGSRWRAFVHPGVRPDRQYMFVQNHVNHFDFMTMYFATPHLKQGLELEEHFGYPIYGWFMRQRGTIPVRKGERGQSDRIRDLMRAELDRGRSLLVFPEGRRTRDGRVGQFRLGTFFMARDLGVPVVPVAITGMQDVMRADSWIVRPGRQVTVHCLEPIETSGIPDDGIQDLADRVRGPIARIVDEYIDGRDRRR